MSKVVLGAALVSGTAIGAGIFSLPFVFSQIGVGFALLYFVAFAFICSFINLRYVRLLEIAGEGHHYIYISKLFLKKPWARTASFITFVTLIFNLTVYLILSASFSSLIWDTNSVLLIFLFWIIASIPIFLKVSWESLVEFIGLLGILAITAVIFISGLSGNGSILEFNTFFKKVDPILFLLPFGPLLYSLPSRNVMAKVFELMKGDRVMIKKSLILGTIVTVLVYILFVVGILGLSSTVSPDTISGLNFLPGWSSVVLGVIGLLTLGTSYMTIGGNMFETLKTDVFNYKTFFSAALVLIGPPLLFILGLNNFLFAVGFVGGTFLALEAIFINSMWHKAEKKKIGILSLLVFLVFSISILYELYILFT